jgi:transposase
LARAARRRLVVDLDAVRGLGDRDAARALGVSITTIANRRLEQAEADLEARIRAGRVA